MPQAALAVSVSNQGIVEDQRPWKSKISGVKSLHQHFKLYLIALIGLTLIAEIGVILVGGKYIDLEDSISTTWGAVTAAGVIKVAGSVIPKLRTRAMNKIKEEGKQLEALTDGEAKEIGVLLHKIAVLADSDSRQFERRIQSLWTLYPAIVAGNFETPYNYLSSGIAALAALIYIGSDWYQIAASARKADKLFNKLEGPQPLENT